MSNSDSQKFITTFFNKINNIIEKKGGKRKNKSSSRKKYKRQKAGGKNGELDLPIPLNDKDIYDILQLKQAIQSNSSLANNTKINISSSNNNLENVDNVEEFTQHIKLILQNIKLNPKPVIDMTPEELQIFSLYLSYTKLESDIQIASSILDDSLSNIKSLSDYEKTMIEDESSQENLSLSSTLYKNISGSNNLTDKMEESIVSIKDNVNKDIKNLTNLYKNGASPEEISSASTSSFLNLFGYLSFLFSLLGCFQNRLSEYNQSLKSKNPIIYAIISIIYSSISFILFCIGKIFMFLWNTRIGRLYILFVFLKLYKENNSIAVFIANIIVQLIGMVDKSLGASTYINEFIKTTQTILISSLPTLLNNDTIKALLSSSIASALMNPTVLANFMNSLTPELSSQIIQQSLPILSESLKDTITNATPEMIQTITQGISQQVGPQIISAITQGTANMASELAPSLIEGISTTVSGNMQSMVTNAATTAITEAGKNMAQQQITGSILNGVSNVALSYGAQIVSYYLTGDTSSANLITNSIGGKKTKKKIKKTKKSKSRKRYRKF